MVHPDVAAAYVQGKQVPGTILREEVSDVSLTPYILDFEPQWEEVTRDLISTVCLKDQSGSNTGYAEKTYRVVYIDINPNSPTYGYLWIAPVKEEVEDTKSCPIDNFMYIENSGNGVAQVSMKYTGSSVGLEYCIRGVNSHAGEWRWTSLDFNILIEINHGEKLYLRGNNPEGLDGINVFISKKPDSGDPYITLGGSVQSLCDGTGTSTTAFYMEGLFFGCTYIKSVSKGFLPATTLVSGCYRNMFNGCSEIENAPELPAVSLAQECYRGMFSGCTSLVNAPELPAATTLKQGCYRSMFSGCTSLVNAPELPATLLVQECYANMFAGCTSLVNAPALPATTSGVYCYKSMFAGCTSLTSAPNLPAKFAASNCYQEMFKDCTSLVNAPTISAEQVKSGSCMMMFQNCISLVNAPALPALNLGPSCYSGMFAGCTSLKHAPDLRAESSDLKSSCYSGMFFGCLFNMSDNGTSFNFDCGVTFPYSGAAGTFNTPYDMATWMGNTRGLNEPANYMYILNTGNKDATIDFSAGEGVKIEIGIEKDGVIQWNSFNKLDLESQGKIYLRGNNNEGLNGSCFSISGVSIKLGGSVQSLCDRTGMSTVAYDMRGLFMSNDIEISVEPEFLPATTLVENCYKGMFKGCFGLVNAPKLPATALTENCYEDMFFGCLFNMSDNGTSFNFDCGVTFPYSGDAGTFNTPYDMATWMGNTRGLNEPANYMYIECIDKSTPAEITFSRVDEINMEYGREKEGVIMWSDWAKEEFQPINIEPDYRVYFRGINDSLSGCHFSTGAIDLNGKIRLGGSVQSLCDGNGTSAAAFYMPYLFVGNDNIFTIESGFLPATTLSKGCYHHMFADCFSLTNAPDLPATTLSEGCYEMMFSNCKFNMSDNGTSFNFGCGVTFPYDDGKYSFAESYNMADWMGNTNGLKKPADKFMYIENIGGGIANVGFTTPKASEINMDFGLEKEGVIKWNNWSGDGFKQLDLERGDKIYFRGYNESLLECHFVIDKSAVKLGGSVQSLCDGDGASTTAFNMGKLFYDNDYIKEIESGFLSATVLTENCYADIFSGCTLLANAPDLRATILTKNCYQNMFNDCVFKMSTDGNTFAFDCGITFPYNSQEISFDTPHEMAEWMGNTNGFK